MKTTGTNRILFVLFPVIIVAAGWVLPWTEAATRYDGDGVICARLEAERWYINRARFAPEMEADRFGLTNNWPNGHPYYDVCEDGDDTNDFGSTTNDWVGWRVPRQPLAPNARLSTAASNHCRDMAETGKAQHSSPSGNYYSLSNSPAERAAAEGYTNQILGYYENIASSARGISELPYFTYGRRPDQVHWALFVDTNNVPHRGHRQTILNSTAREIGLGHVRTNYFNGGYYYTHDYDTQDFGRTSSNHFFTGTIFYDNNTNGAYDASTNGLVNEGEGVEGVEVHLWNGGSEAVWYDVSEACGSFAIPINDLPNGAEIQVELFNAGASPVNLTMPLSYNTLGALILTQGESFVYGSYTQPCDTNNIGFRDTTPFVDSSHIWAGSNVYITVAALGRVSYAIDSCDGSITGGWINFATSVASNGSLTFIDSGQGGRPAPSQATTRFYRVRLLR